MITSETRTNNKNLPDFSVYMFILIKHVWNKLGQQQQKTVKVVKWSRNTCLGLSTGSSVNRWSDWKAQLQLRMERDNTLQTHDQIKVVTTRAREYLSPSNFLCFTQICQTAHCCPIEKKMDLSKSNSKPVARIKYKKLRFCKPQICPNTTYHVHIIRLSADCHIRTWRRWSWSCFSQQGCHTAGCRLSHSSGYF